MQICYPDDSLVGSDAPWDASNTEIINPCVRHILSRRFGHENISTAILPLPLIEESSCQLMAKECRLSTYTDKLPLGGLPRNSVVRINDCPDMTSMFPVKVCNKSKQIIL